MYNDQSLKCEPSHVQRSEPQLRAITCTTLAIQPECLTRHFLAKHAQYCLLATAYWLSAIVACLLLVPSMVNNSKLSAWHAAAICSCNERHEELASQATPPDCVTKRSKFAICDACLGTSGAYHTTTANHCTISDPMLLA